MKPIIGISQGDPNGVGLEVIIKTFRHEFIYKYCTPVLYGSPKTFIFHKKALGLNEPSYHLIKDVSEAREGKLNLIATGKEDVNVQFGTPSEQAGAEAFAAIAAMARDAKAGKLHAMVTAPIDKSTIKNNQRFTGHTGYIASELEVKQYAMFLVSDELRVALVTEHLSIKEVASALSADLIVAKLDTISKSLKTDFGIVKPKIAVLGLNPHSGDNGLIGQEEQQIIIPAIERANKENVFAFGPYSADGFFGMKQYLQFDAVLAMYHDQGLIPFKSIAFDDGINYTAGLPVIRTSPDHGTAYNIAGKNIASERSFSNAVFAAIEIFNQRNENADLRSNPLKYTDFRRERFRLEL